MTRTDSSAVTFEFTARRAREAAYMPTDIVGYDVHETGPDGWSNHYLGEIRRYHAHRWSARTSIFRAWDEEFKTRHDAATWLKAQYDAEMERLSRLGVDDEDESEAEDDDDGPSPFELVGVIYVDTGDDEEE